MRFDPNKTFPYPVLRPHSDDYIGVEFQANVAVRVRGEEAEFTCTYLTSSDELQDEVKRGNARYVSVISCRDTYFSRVISTDQVTATRALPADQLRGEVRIDSYIACVKAIDSFTSPDINPEFGQTVFSFEPGHVLAQEETAVVYIDRDLFKPVTAVFDLVKSDALAANEWRINLADAHVQIEVNPAMKEVIDDARNLNENRAVLLNSLYFAAVTHALQKLREAPDEHEEKKWGQVLQRQLQNKNLNINAVEPYLLAQELMKYPLGVLRAYVFKGSQT